MDEKKINVNDKEFVLKKPNSKIRKESDTIYAKAYRRAIADGFFLEAEIDNIIKDRGIKASNEKEKKLIDNKISDLEIRFQNNKFKDMAEGIEKYYEIISLRRDLEELDKAKRELSTQSASIIAENERFAYFVYACSFSSDGDLVWETLDEYKEDVSDLAVRISSEMVSFIYEGTSALLEEIAKIRPENVWYSNIGKEEPNEESDKKKKKKSKLQTVEQ